MTLNIMCGLDDGTYLVAHPNGPAIVSGNSICTLDYNPTMDQRTSRDKAILEYVRLSWPIVMRAHSFQRSPTAPPFARLFRVWGARISRNGVRFMAGDWVKMRSNLDTHPKVVAIACDLDTSELHVVGMLWKVWTWADQHSLDGNAICVTESFLNRITGNANFSTALRKVGWLDGNDGELTFPRFSEHNGKTAKSRSETALRVNKHRSEVKQKCNAPTVTNALPEKRREEKKEEVKTHARGDELTGFLQRSPAFEQFMKTYPRPTSPEAAWEVWQAKVYTEAMRHGKSDAEIEEMIVMAAQEFRDSPAGKPPDGSQDYRPAAAKWLQGNCWEEPRELWQQPNGKATTKSRQPAKPKIRPLEVDQKIGQQLQDLMK